MTTAEQTYPRPDFVRKNVLWASLNGKWDFIFDDEDVGILYGWQAKGLPESVAIKGTSGTRAKVSTAEDITRQIAAQPENLLKENVYENTKDRNVNKKQQIQVPFVFQTPASCIHSKGAHEVIWYERDFTDPRSSGKDHVSDRVLLRFGAVDYEATVWLNGRYVGGHRGGHVPFELDITEAIDAQSLPHAKLIIRVRDSPYDLTQPRGKQYWGPHPESIFYTPSSGIWQSVWLECAPSTRIADCSHGTILRSNDTEKGLLHARIALVGRRSGKNYKVQIEARLGGVDVVQSEISAIPGDTDHVNIDLAMLLPKIETFPPSVQDTLRAPGSCSNGVALWSPEHPNLYDITLRLFDELGVVTDEIQTYTGMRSLSWVNGDGTFRLNGQPIFQMLVLDQGYWPETGLTPPSAESLKMDIELAKRMGFNGCRKHQKVEDPYFLFWADKLGYLVWGEIANAYRFNEDYVDRFDQEWMEAVKRDMNHPCIVTWTPVNESWGYPSLKSSVEQRNHIRALYYKTKTLDPTRSINDNCGWEHVCDDLITFHDYSDAAELTETCRTMDGILSKKAGREVFVPKTSLDQGAAPRSKAPVICTEFGGVNIAPSKDGGEAGERDWGYTTASDPTDLLRRVENLALGIAKGGHCCGFVYTQLADIEQEVNGLFSFNRKPKLDEEGVKKIMNDARDVYHKSLSH